MEEDVLSFFEQVPINKFQENFDTYMEKIEVHKESFVIIGDDGNKVIMMPADEELIRIHTELNNDAS